MLRGRFGKEDRPYLEAGIQFPGLGVQARLWFLVDTGCDVTALMPQDGIAMGLPYNALRSVQPGRGVGGPVEGFREPGLVIFNEGGRHIQVYAIDVEALRADGPALGLPSLLGHDILDRWRMTYAPLASQLDFEVLQADATVPISP